MAVPFRSIDDALANDASQGSLTRMIYFPGQPAVTAATTGSGYESFRRFDRAFTVPTFTGNAYMTHFRAFSTQTTAMVMAAIEIDLGNINLATGTFTDGSAMPTRTIGGGSSAQLASVIPMLWVSSNLTATTPTITVTYKNQAGTGSHTAAPVLPSTAVINSAYMLSPVLQSGDTGIQDVTNMTKSAGTVGVIHCVGLLPLAVAVSGSNTFPTGDFDVLAAPMEMYPIVAGDVISFWAGNPLIANTQSAFEFQLQAEV